MKQYFLFFYILRMWWESKKKNNEIHWKVFNDLNLWLKSICFILFISPIEDFHDIAVGIYCLV